MSAYTFGPAERAAIYSVHRERCYLCGKPLTLKTMEVDHIIPEALLLEPARLSTVLASLGRAPGFRLNSFENWLPACGPCNNEKGQMVFEPSPIVQVQLQKAAAKAHDVAALVAETVSERKTWNALKSLKGPR